MGFFDSIFGKKKEEKKTEDKRICPVCGNSFTGRGMDVHDTKIRIFILLPSKLPYLPKRVK